jgi:uncharacterized protein YndB with AHSA1/START domain
MVSSSVLHQQGQAQLNALGRRTVRNSQAIDIKVEVPADARRLFVALTEPEFLEAWVCLPGMPLGLNPIVSRTGEDLHFAFINPGVKAEVIVWESLVCRRRKIVLRWARYLQSARSASIVDIRLRGNFGSTVVDLNHSGIGDLEECDWCRHLWKQSLSRLSILMQHPAGHLARGEQKGHHSL